MKMKDLKMYVSPETEILDMEAEDSLLAGSPGSSEIDQPDWAPANDLDD